MKIIDIIKSEKPSLSFEVFPPKTSDSLESVKSATEQIATLKPSFMSVTYGAGGGTSEFTLEIAKNLQNNQGVTALAHLTCVNSTKDEVKSRLKMLKENGIRTHVMGKINEGSTEIEEAIRHGHIAYIINTRDVGAAPMELSDGYQIRKFATESNTTIFTSLDTVKVLLDVLEETTLTISTIDA